MRTIPENMDPYLLTAFLSNETSPEENILVKEWIASSDENRARFEAINKIWNVSETAFPHPANVDTEKAWQKLADKIQKYELEKPHIGKSKEKHIIFLRYALRAAAVFIPILLAGYLIFSYYSKPKLLSFVTTQAISEKTLSDGSVIKLNQNSELKYPEAFGDLTREVTFTGEAFFKVFPNPEKPFIIHSIGIDVKVVGTSFNVNSNPASGIIEVFVKEGKVILFAVNSKGIKTDSIFLEAGSKGIFEKRASLLRKIIRSDDNDLFWIDKTLVFDKIPLDTVFSVIEEKYDVRIKLKNKETGNLRLTTSFVDQPIDSVMNVIAESFKLKISRSGLTFEIDAAQN
jgi:ferric-dicitrate binding protein FerR (iron transport regulator)